MEAIEKSRILWEPSPEQISGTNLTRYGRWLEEQRGLKFADYSDLWKWSTDEPNEFWMSLVDFFELRFHRSASCALESTQMPGASWFPGATLNYAEHVLRPGKNESDAAILFEAQTSSGAKRSGKISRSELRDGVGAIAAAFREMGVAPGDCVAGYLGNTPETVMAFLAAASLGAIWSNCSLEMSSRGVLDRLEQIKPTVLVAAGGYGYGGKWHDRRTVIEEIVGGLSDLQHLVLIPEGGNAEPVSAGWATKIHRHDWETLLATANASPLVFEAVPFDHPLWILYSSGTTGKPKAIVHGHGGILLEHRKALSLHLDLREGDRFFWYTTSGWMMWNFLVSGLLLPGVSIVLYDGSPKHPDFAVLWDIVERHGISYFGASAPYFMACLKEGMNPRGLFSLDRLRGIGSTGAPLPAEGFEWIYEQVKRDVLLGSVSGGTDVCTAFVLSNPNLPVRAGQLQCLGLGAKIEAWTDEGRSVFGQVGELVLTAPFPSMPVFFWGDTDGSGLRASYFEKFPGAWSHGDWIEIESVGGPCVIHGRSDATLNRGGVRMGTVEFYAIVEAFPEIAEALVIDTGGLDRDESLVLFVVLQADLELDDALRARINHRLRSEVSPRHVPDTICQVPAIPHTLNGKKMEVPVKRILTGKPVGQAAHARAVQNPEALQFFVDFYEKSIRSKTEITS